MSRAASTAVHCAQNSSSVEMADASLGGASGEAGPLPEGEDGESGTPIRVRERSAIMRPNAGRVGPTNCACLGTAAASFDVLEGERVETWSTTLDETASLAGGERICFSSWTACERLASSWRTCASSSLSDWICGLRARAVSIQSQCIDQHALGIVHLLTFLLNLG